MKTPKYILRPDYYSDAAKQKRAELEKIPLEKLSKKHKDFLTTMYHIDEWRAGLL